MLKNFIFNYTFMHDCLSFSCMKLILKMHEKQKYCPQISWLFFAREVFMEVGLYIISYVAISIHEDFGGNILISMHENEIPVPQFYQA